MLILVHSWAEPDLHEKREVGCQVYTWFCSNSYVILMNAINQTRSYVSKTSYLIGSCTYFSQPKMTCSDLIGLQFFAAETKMGIGLKPDLQFFMEVSLTTPAHVPDDHNITRTQLVAATGNWQTVHPNNISHSV